jgi:hypothetical protein
MSRHHVISVILVAFTKIVIPNNRKDRYERTPRPFPPIVHRSHFAFDLLATLLVTVVDRFIHPSRSIQRREARAEQPKIT